ncbi:carbohydrate ABC transporter permease [Paenibacillus sp. HWE-109]|uniref:carbohydrate ABC transporter permease n=1 Tax=Paenibacillus sp. HWE-109 TaxID=1306526 RepID=UPI001EDF14F0|nr:carbohydrate ABC transporter permease [Paenibacillus sp. HWE-109]UKS27022.1 carbohydrate ABC transporter permease [Paenibacillus sp. HWE-109]
MRFKRTLSEVLFDRLNYVLLALISAAMMLPFVNVLASSLSSGVELSRGGLVLWPRGWSLEAYSYIFKQGDLIKALGVTIFITVIGTALNLIITFTLAYALSKSQLPFRNPMLMLVFFTTLFSGGMIPTFILVKNLGLLDSLWALIIPGAASAFNIIIVKSFMQTIPDGLEESATIDGCTEYGTFFRIVLPISMPIIATMILFYAVGHWNEFFQAILYINNPSKWPMQVFLRQVLLVLSSSELNASMIDQDQMMELAEPIKMAMVIVATVPIVIVYPFLQKYFVKGVMIGSIKG